MSRYYRINVRAKNTNLQELNEVLECDFGWDSTTDAWEETWIEDKETIYCYEGEGSLCGGMSEEECYTQIRDKWLSINVNVKCEITLTYLEDLPQSTFGSLED